MHDHDQRLTRHARTDGPNMSRLLRGLPNHISLAAAPLPSSSKERQTLPNPEMRWCRILTAAADIKRSGIAMNTILSFHTCWLPGSLHVRTERAPDVMRMHPPLVHMTAVSGEL